MEYALKLDSPNQPAKSIKLTGDKILLGTLLSNHIVLQGKEIDPIHALIESHDDGNRWVMTDLGSQSGIKLNGQMVEVEADISPSDVVEIGDNKLVIEVVRAEVAGRPAPPPFANKTAVKTTVDQKAVGQPPIISSAKSPAPIEPESPAKRIGASLFNIKEARPRGRVLEVVAYWDQTILEAEYFHKDFKDFNKVTIGSTGKSHFIAANKDIDNIRRHVLAKFDGSGYKLRLLDGMTARIRKGGKVVKLSGKQSVSLGNRDIVHIVYGAVKYFLIFVKPPEVILPPARNRDPLFTGLLMIAMMVYLLCIPTLWYIGAKITESRKDDIWAVIYKPIKKPKPIKKVVVKKKIAKVKDKKPIKKPPPPPKPKPVKPAKATKKKPKKPKVKPQGRKQKQPVKIGGAVTKPKKRAKPKKPSGGRAGIRSSGVGNRKKMGGGRKGKGRTSVKGVKNVNNKKSSGVNLSKLGVDVGTVLSKRGPGARYTDFKSSAGGAGGGRGSQVKTTGLGGLGKQHSLSVRGTKGALNKFGSGQGVLAGGGRGSGLGKGFGRGSGRGVAVNISPGDGVVDGGLTQGEVAAIIRQNLNRIRHCYEKLIQRSPGVRGKVKVGFSIATNGRVRGARVINSTIGDGTFKNCIRSRIGQLKFPRPRGGSKVDVSYPFVFNPV